MKKTKFQTGRNLLVIISEIKRGNKNAEAAISKEITRLENRIREIENGGDSDEFIKPKEIEL